MSAAQPPPRPTYDVAPLAAAIIADGASGGLGAELCYLAALTFKHLGDPRPLRDLAYRAAGWDGDPLGDA